MTDPSLEDLADQMADGAVQLMRATGILTDEEIAVALLKASYGLATGLINSEEWARALEKGVAVLRAKDHKTEQ